MLVACSCKSIAIKGRKQLEGSAWPPTIFRNFRTTTRRSNRHQPEIIELHHDKHHAAYVKGANDTLEQLAEARDKDQWGSINGLEKNLAFHLSGHILHSIYWHNMTGDGGGEPLDKDGVGELADAIAENFGSFAKFKAQLTKPRPPPRAPAGASWPTSRSPAA